MTQFVDGISIHEATKRNNEAALCRALQYDPHDDWALVPMDWGMIPKTVLYNAKRGIGVQITGIMHRGRIWMDGCPLHWTSKAALHEANWFITRCGHKKLIGDPTKG